MRERVLACVAGVFLQGYLALGADVVSFTLINGKTNAVVEGYDPIPADAVIDMGASASKTINIRANTDGKVGCVSFTLTGPEDARTEENWKPFTLFPTSLDWEPVGGNYTLKARSFSEPHRKGTPGAVFAINFTIVQPNPPNPGKEVKKPAKADAKTKKPYPENPP